MPHRHHGSGPLPASACAGACISSWVAVFLHFAPGINPVLCFTQDQELFFQRFERNSFGTGFHAVLLVEASSHTQRWPCCLRTCFSSSPSHPSIKSPPASFCAPFYRLVCATKKSAREPVQAPVDAPKIQPSQWVARSMPLSKSAPIQIGDRGCW